MVREVVVMSGAPKVPRYVAFGLAMLVSFVGTAFFVGEVFADPGGYAAVGLVAAWGLPMVALSAYVLVRPAAATTALVVIAILVSLFIVLDTVFRLLPRHIGPVGPVAVFAVAVAGAFLGMRRPVLAGSLLVLLGIASLGAAVETVTGPGETAPIGVAFGGSFGAVGVAVLVVGGLFLLAGAWEAWLGHRSRPVSSAH
jgi:hypothetical protein